MTVPVRAIVASDFASILRINRECLPHVAVLDEPELRRLTAIDGFHAVAGHDGNVMGYALAMWSEAAYDGEEFQHLSARLRDRFLYVDQIAVSAAARGGKLGSLMYAHLRSACEERGIGILCCEVNLEPLNRASLEFHRGQGFVAFDELETADGRRVALLKAHI